MQFKGHNKEKRWRTNQNVMDYRHMIFIRKYTHIKYLCEMIIFQKNFYLKGCCHFMLEWWTFLMLWGKNTTNKQCIISATQPHFSMQSIFMRKITYSWCYEERNERHISIHYTRVLEVKEVTYLYQGDIKIRRSRRGSKIYRPYLS